MALTSAQITTAFQNVLQRDPSAAELSAWLNASTSGALTDAQVYAAIVNSAEALNGVSAILRVYQAAFGRVADRAGLDQQTDSFVRGGFTINKIAEGFVVSQEFANRYNGGVILQDNAAAVTDALLQSLYQNVLGRAGSAAEIAAWKATLTTPGSGYTKASDILIGFSQSVEFTNKAASAISTFLTAAAQGTAVYTGALLDPTQGTGTNVTLTVNQDTLTGGSGAENFVAGAAQNGAGALINTLQNVDSIDGGAGSDRLTATLSTATTVTPSLKSIETVEIRSTAAGAVLDLSGSTGVETIIFNNGTASGQANAIGAANQLNITNQSQNVFVGGAAGSATTLGLKFDTVGTAAALSLLDLGVDNASKATTLNIVTNNAHVKIDSTKADVATTVTVNSTGTNSLALWDSAATVTSATLTGAGSVDMRAQALTAVKTFDGSAASGAIKVDIASAAIATVKTGSGADLIDMDTTVTAGSTVAAGAGNDVVLTGGKLANFNSVDGGEGTDVISINDGAVFIKANVAKITGFETLDVAGGTGTYDLSLASFATVQIDAANGAGLAGAVVFSNAAAGQALRIASNKADFTTGKDVTITLKDATGSSDAITVNSVIVDGNNNATVEGNITVTKLISAGVETVTLDSTASAVDTGKASTLYSTTYTEIVVDAIKTLNVTGNAGTAITTLTNAGNTLTTVNAGTATGPVAMSLAGINTATGYTGSAGVDTVTSSDKGTTYYTGAGADVLTLKAGAQDVLVYKAATDSVIVDTNADGKLTIAADVAKIDGITGFQTGGGLTTDRIDVTNFAFTGAAGAVVNVSAKVAGTTDLTSIANLFQDVAGNRGVASAIVGADSYVFIDVNKDGNFTAANDIVVKLTGLGTGITNTDVQF